MKCYLTAVEAKLLQPVNETFCSIPTDGVNCCNLDRLTSRALVAQCKPIKKGQSGDGGSGVSLMIKSTKIRRGRRRKFTQWGLHTFHHGNPPDL